MRAIRSLAQWRGGYLFAVLVIAVVTLVLLPLRPYLSYVEIALLFVPVIGVAARLAGLRPALLGALLAFLAVDFLFVPPFYTLSVAQPRDWITLGTFLLVAVASGLQTAHMSQREADALQREREVGMLNRLSSRLISEGSAETMAAHIAHEVVAVLGAGRSSIHASAPGGEAVLLAEAGGPASGRAEEAFAEWVLANDKAVGLPSVPGLSMAERPASVGVAGAVDGAVADGVYLPLQTPRGLEGVLYARPVSNVRSFGRDQLRMLVAISNLASSYLERQRLVRDAAMSAAAHEAERLQGTLVNSVSHELKTPLASITATVTGLLEEDAPIDPERVRAELRAVESDLARLDTSIGDLLDLSRLESDSWTPQPERYDLAEILGTVASKLRPEERGRVTFQVPEGLPSVNVDFAQWARVFTHLIENALAYSPEGSEVRVQARSLGADVLVCVEDEGPGVPDDEKQHVFDKFFRGAASAAVPSGTGLGLAIACEIVRSHHGRVWVEDASPRGARFVVTVPAALEEAD